MQGQWQSTPTYCLGTGPGLSWHRPRPVLAQAWACLCQDPPELQPRGANAIRHVLYVGVPVMPVNGQTTSNHTKLSTPSRSPLDFGAPMPVDMSNGSSRRAAPDHQILPTHTHTHTHSGAGASRSLFASRQIFLGVHVAMLSPPFFRGPLAKSAKCAVVLSGLWVLWATSANHPRMVRCVLVQLGANTGSLGARRSARCAPCIMHDRTTRGAAFILHSVSNDFYLSPVTMGDNAHTNLCPVSCTVTFTESHLTA
jgi:hypothetical protein